MRNHTGIRPWQLTGPNTENATLVAGGSIRFQLADIPYLTSGTLCNHLLGIFVTFLLEIGADGVQGDGYDQDVLLTALVDSVEVRNCWHGTPVSQNHVRGCMLGLIEFLSCGYQYFARRACVLTAGEFGGNFHKVSCFIPLYYGMGQKGHHTALPVAMYKNAELVINGGTFLAGDHGEQEADTIKAVTVRASAILLPESEIHVGPGQQFIDYPYPANAGSEAIQVPSLGAATTLQKVEAGAGVDFLAWLSSHYCQTTQWLGSARVKDIIRADIPFRGTQMTRHLEAFLAGLEAAVGGREIGESDLFDGTVQLARVSNHSGWPYAPNYAGQLIADQLAGGVDIRDMLVFPIIYPGRDLEVSKMQVFEGTQTYHLEFAAGHTPSNGSTHHTYVHQWQSWTPEGWDDAMRLLVNEGVARAVLGQQTGLVWSTKLIHKNPDAGKIDPSKARFFAQKLTLGKVGA